MEAQASPSLSQQFVEIMVLLHNNFGRQTQVPLPLNQFGVLCALMDTQGMAIIDLSRQLNISKQQMTTVIDKLVCNGMVQKAPDPHDRRRSVITLTPAGQKILDDQNERVRQLFNQHMQQLNEDETAQLSDSILTFNQLLEKMFIN